MPRAFMHSAEVGGPAAAAKPCPAGKPVAGLTAASAPPAATPAALNSVQAVAAARIMYRALIWTSCGQGPCGWTGDEDIEWRTGRRRPGFLNCRGPEQYYC